MRRRHCVGGGALVNFSWRLFRIEYMYFLAKREKIQEKPKVFEETLEKPRPS